MPGNGFHDFSRHHRWATERLLEFCEALDGATRLATVPATYGSIIETLHHLANEHRAQVCSALGALGIDPPGVSVWVYALETGRAHQTEQRVRRD